ncbi:hypothetical protein MJD09_11720 [bacterium]|nr:hypothetical protein [bacterium]
MFTATWGLHRYLGSSCTILSISDEAGSFTIQNVPAGNHTVVAWHEVLGEIEKTVTVEPGKTATVGFDILPNE